MLLSLYNMFHVFLAKYDYSLLIHCLYNKYSYTKYDKEKMFGHNYAFYSASYNYEGSVSRTKLVLLLRGPIKLIDYIYVYESLGDSKNLYYKYFEQDLTCHYNLRCN